jgi:energy-coupling factor transporter ATP-binding protein EcfA2
MTQVVKSEVSPQYNTNPFAKAVKYEARGRMCIVGPSGSGKTYTALSIATAMGGKIALVDTEHGSASKYADLFNFDVIEMSPPYNPMRYVEMIQAAEKAGYDVLILDSLTHAWSGTGGLLEFVDERSQALKGNKFAAWKDATPLQNALVEEIIGANLHIIATMRSKQGYVLEQDKDDKMHPRKVGMEPIQRDGFEYEFDVFAEMTVPENDFIVSKSRCPALNGKVFKLPGKNVADIFFVWLQGEERPKFTPVSQPAAQAKPVLRPLPPEEVKRVLHVKAQKKANPGPATEKQVQLLNSMMSNALAEVMTGADDSKPRHLCLSWQWDVAGGSARSLSGGQASVTIDWLIQGSGEGKFELNADAQAELLLIYRRAQIDAGQAELPFEETKP